MPVPPVLLVAAGGAAGAAARYGVAVVATGWLERLPLGTWIVNALGCFLIGLALPLVATDRVRLLAIVGFLGSFTTFSTYSADTLALWTAGRPGWAVANALGSVVVGLAFTGVGLAVGRSLAA